MLLKIVKDRVRKVKQEEQSRAVGLPLVISIIAISFAAIFVKWSEAPATVLSMYRMLLASILLLPMVWVKREEFQKITRKDWFLLFFFQACF